MEFTVSKSDLVRELSLSQGVVEKKTTIPILSNVLLETAGDRVTLTATDLELKLGSFRDYYNEHRTHSALKGQTPIENPGSKGALLNRYRWQTHCRGLYQTPIAA